MDRHVCTEPLIVRVAIELEISSRDSRKALLCPGGSTIFIHTQEDFSPVYKIQLSIEKGLVEPTRQKWLRY